LKDYPNIKQKIQQVKHFWLVVVVYFIFSIFIGVEYQRV
jgi:hypothetical protein